MPDYLSEDEIKRITKHVFNAQTGAAPENAEAYQSPDFWIGHVCKLLEHVDLLQKDIDEKEEWDYTGEW